MTGAIRKGRTGAIREALSARAVLRRYADLRGIPLPWRMAGTLALLAAPCDLALRPGAAPEPR